MATSELILVHGAAGNLGSLIIEQLLARGTPPASIVAGVRDSTSEKSKKLAAKGVSLRVANYDNTEALTKAYAGIHTVVFVPITAAGIERATAADHSIGAATTAGVKRYVQVSWGSGSVETRDWITPGYLFAEARLRQSGLNWLIIRNGIWLDNQFDAFRTALKTGTLQSTAKPHIRGPHISRLDTAKGIAAAVSKKDLAHRVLQLHNNVSYSFTELAAALGEVAGKKIDFQTIPVADLAAKFAPLFGPAAPYIAAMMDSVNHALEHGEYKVSNDFFELTGQLPETPKEYYKRAVLTSGGA